MNRMKMSLKKCCLCTEQEIRDSHCHIQRFRIINLVLVNIVDNRVLHQISDAFAALQGPSDSRRAYLIRNPFGHDTNVVLEMRSEKIELCNRVRFVEKSSCSLVLLLSCSHIYIVLRSRNLFVLCRVYWENLYYFLCILVMIRMFTMCLDKMSES